MTVTTTEPTRVHIGIAPGFRGYGCNACDRELDKLEVVGIYRHANHPGEEPPFSDTHEHFLCENCCKAGAEAIAEAYRASAAREREVP